MTIPEYKQRQAIETDAMEFWTDFINSYPKVFKKRFEELSLVDKCKIKAFIQVRDSALYKRLTEILEDE